MGQPAAVMNDRITGQCLSHQMPNPGTGAPQPAGPLGFSAPLLQGLAQSVLIGGKPAAVQGSFGMNTPPHLPPLHATDPYAMPSLQRGSVVRGSATVLFEGKPAAATGSSCTCCLEPGQLQGSATSVLIGG